jgi:nucleotide-binding universal stress UspA family protein
MTRVLIATDGSDSAGNALAFAIDFAKRYDADLHALYVEPERAPPRALEQFAKAEHIPNTASAIYHAISEGVLDHAEDRAKDAGVKTVVRESAHGDAAKAIVDYATGHSIDVIVMGTRGFSELKGLLVGSVSMKVQAHAPCTVITVR